MGKRAVLKRIAAGFKTNRRGRLYSPGAKQAPLSESDHKQAVEEVVVEDVADAEEAEEVVKEEVVASTSKTKRSYSRKKRSPKSLK